MKTWLTFIGLLTLTGLHCQKELSSDSAVQHNLPGKEQLLTREVSFTTGNPNLKQVREFTYDDENRCTQVVLGTIDSSGSVPPTLNVSRTLTFFYNSGSSLPYKIASVRTVFPNLTTYFYFKYDTKGVKDQDSVRALNQAGEPADRVINYKYDKDLIIATPVMTNFPIFLNPLDSLFIDKSNIVKKTSRVPTTSGDQLYLLTFEYDNKINPYAAINIFNSLYFTNPALNIAYNVPTETHYIGYSKNNFTSITSQGAFKTLYIYDYDQYKYPVKRVSFPESVPTSKTTTYFTYKDKK